MTHLNEVVNTVDSQIVNESNSKENIDTSVASEAPEINSNESSSTSTVADTIAFLIANNLSAIPVVQFIPATDSSNSKWDSVNRCYSTDSDGQKLPIFDGQSPSYINKKGIARTVGVNTYKNERPNEKKLKEWFANQSVRIGTILPDGRFVTLPPTPNAQMTLSELVSLMEQTNDTEPKAPAIVASENEADIVPTEITTVMPAIASTDNELVEPVIEIVPTEITTATPAIATPTEPEADSVPVETFSDVPAISPTDNELVEPEAPTVETPAIIEEPTSDIVASKTEADIVAVETVTEAPIKLSYKDKLAKLPSAKLGEEHPFNKLLKLLGFKRAGELTQSIDGELVIIRGLASDELKREIQSNPDDIRQTVVTIRANYPVNEEKLEKLRKLCAYGYGIHFVLQGGSGTKNGMARAKCLVFEYDDKDMTHDDQREMYIKLNLPKPTQINSGNKSIHCIYPLTESAPIREWQDAQDDLLNTAKGSDQSFDSSCHMLRVPGYLHEETGNVSVIEYTSKRFELDKLREFIEPISEDAREKLKAKRAKKSKVILTFTELLENSEKSLEIFSLIQNCVWDIQKLDANYFLTVDDFVNGLTKNVLIGKERLNAAFKREDVPEDAEYPIARGCRRTTFLNVGEDIRILQLIYETLGLDNQDSEVNDHIDRLIGMCDLTDGTTENDMLVHFNSKNDSNLPYLSGLLKRIYDRVYQDLFKLQQQLKKDMKANKDIVILDEQVETVNKEVKKVTDDDDLMDIALNSGSDNATEEPLTPEELEARKISNQERFNSVITSVDDLKIVDNLDLFTPPLARYVKALLEEKQVRGGSWAVLLCGITAIAAVSNLTIVKCVPLTIDRPSLPFTWNIGESAVGKGDFGFKPVKSARTFYKQLDSFSLARDNVMLQKEIDNKNEALIEEFQNCFKTKLKSNTSVHDFGINTIYLYNPSSSKEGNSKDIGNHLAAQRLHKIYPEYFSSLYSHPQACIVDEFERVAEKMFGSNNEIYLNTIDLCESKEDFSNDNANKKLSNGQTVVGNRPLVFSGNMTTKSAFKNISTEKQSQTGFTARLILNFQDGKKFQVDTSKFDEIKLNKLNNEDYIRLLILGSSICNHIEALIKTRHNLNYKTIWNISKEAGILYEKYINDGGLKDVLIKDLKNKYPDWISLIDNINDKNWQSIVDVAPNLKRLNWGVENFLNRLKVIYPGRKLDDFAPLLELTGDGDELITFAKILVTELPNGHTYQSDLEQPLTIENILKPLVIDANGNPDPTDYNTSYTNDTELYGVARNSARFNCLSPLNYTINAHDMELAISVAANSIISFGNMIAANKISNAFGDTQSLANEARAQEILRKSESEIGELLRIQDLITVLHDRYKQNNFKFTIAEITRLSSKLKKIESYIPDILTRMLDIGGFINELGKNKRGATMYEIVKIPTDTDIRQFAFSKL